MGGCCSLPVDTADVTPGVCPKSATHGKRVPLITLKSLLLPRALEHLKPDMTYYFCPEATCEVTYINDGGDFFTLTDLKVPVYPKDDGDDVPVCYCFGWTRRRLREDLARHGHSTSPERIKANVQCGVCGCEVNNPQGSCCLGNVQRTIREMS